MNFREAVKKMQQGKFLAYGDHTKKDIHNWYTWKESRGTGPHPRSGDLTGYIISSGGGSAEIKRFWHVYEEHPVLFEEAFADDWFVIEDVDAFVNMGRVWEQERRRMKVAAEKAGKGIGLFES